MSTQKPQKALRNLFTRTEPLEEEIKQPPAQDLKDQPKTNKSKFINYDWLLKIGDLV